MSKITPHHAYRSEIRHQVHRAQMHERKTAFLYVDESGAPRTREQHAFARSFLLAGVVMSGAQEGGYRAGLDRLKRQFWPRWPATPPLPPIVLHDVKIRHGHSPFSFNQDIRKQRELRRQLTNLMDSLSYTAVASIIRRSAFQEDDGGVEPQTDSIPDDLLAFHLLIDAFLDVLQSDPHYQVGRIIMEASGRPQHDRYSAYLDDIRRHGTPNAGAQTANALIHPQIKFVQKRQVGTHPIELCDLLAGELSRWNSSACTTSSSLWRVFSRKVHVRGNRETGRLESVGLRVFPTSDSPQLHERLEQFSRQVYRDRQRQTNMAADI